MQAIPGRKRAFFAPPTANEISIVRGVDGSSPSEDSKETCKQISVVVLPVLNCKVSRGQFSDGNCLVLKTLSRATASVVRTVSVSRSHAGVAQCGRVV
jgi:hypothetical protein